MTRIRGDKGKFVQKSNEARQVRSLRVTDSAWSELGNIAEDFSVTRADLIEKLINDHVLRDHEALKQENEKLKEEIHVLQGRISEIDKSIDNFYSDLNGKNLQVDKLSVSLKRSEKEVESLKSQVSTLENQIHSKITHQLDLFLNPNSFTRERLNKILAPILKVLRSDLHYGENNERYKKIKKAFDNFVTELLNEFSG
jgi:chromosome segregation ATPase